MITAVQNYSVNNPKIGATKVSANKNTAFTGKGKVLGDAGELLIKKANIYFDRLAELWIKDKKPISAANGVFGIYEGMSILSVRTGRDSIVKLVKQHNKPNQIELHYMDKPSRIFNSIVFDVTDRSFGKILEYKNVDKTNLRGLFDYRDEKAIGKLQIEDLNREVMTYLPKLVGNI